MTLYGELPPDKLEKRIRLGCGAVAGIATGLCFGLVALQMTAGWSWFLAGIAGIVFSLLALKFGDRFWIWLIRFFGS